MIKVLFPHQNLGALGLIVFGRYVLDVTMPNQEGWGFSWGSMLRIYWRFRGRRRWFYLPSFRYYADRKEQT